MTTQGYDVLYTRPHIFAVHSSLHNITALVSFCTVFLYSNCVSTRLGGNKTWLLLGNHLILLVEINGKSRNYN